MKTAANLLQADKSLLILVDVQEKLVPALYESQLLLDNCAWMLQVAQHLQVPVLVSEQYPQGLGSTVAALRDLAPSSTVINKLHFSCAADNNCLAQINSYQRQQIVLIGIEAHVCVLQTALELHAAGKQVFVVVDAITSRKLSDKKIAIKRLRDNGVQIISKEMVLFEWLHQSGTPLFKEMSKKFLRN